MELKVLQTVINWQWHLPSV